LTAISVSDTFIADIDEAKEVCVTPKKSGLPDEVKGLMPLTPAVFFILLALADGQKHGYAIMQEVADLSEGKFRMGPGTLYTTIQRLLDLSLIAEVAAVESGGDSRRRYYKLGREGRALLESEVARLESVVRVARQKSLKLRKAE
jgi:DNA-binding PadR family transcriptional regulator